MAAGQRDPFVQQIIDGVREGRLGARSALALLELRDHEGRQVQAHATQQMRNQLHRALDRTLAGDTGDTEDDGDLTDYHRVFDQLEGHTGGQHYAPPRRSVIYDAPGRQGNRQRHTAATGPQGEDDYDRIWPEDYKRAIDERWD
jgi:hypothetical protein